MYAASLSLYIGYSARYEIEGSKGSKNFGMDTHSAKIVIINSHIMSKMIPGICNILDPVLENHGARVIFLSNLLLIWSFKVIV